MELPNNGFFDDKDFILVSMLDFKASQHYRIISFQCNYIFKFDKFHHKQHSCWLPNEKENKHYEIDEPTARISNLTLILPACIGGCVWSTGFAFGLQELVSGLRGSLDTKMLVSVTQDHMVNEQSMMTSIPHAPVLSNINT